MQPHSFRYREPAFLATAPEKSSQICELWVAHAQSEFAMFEVSAALCGSLSGTVNESRISKDGQGPSGGMGGKIVCQSRLLIATYPGELFI